MLKTILLAVLVPYCLLSLVVILAFCKAAAMRVPTPPPTKKET